MLVLFIIFSIAGEVKLVTEISPPFEMYDKNGKLTGISIDIVRAIQKEINDTSPIKVYPWSRAIKLTKLRKNYALFSTLRTKAREKEFKWVGPIATIELVFFKKTDSNITIHSIEDAKKVGKIGVTSNVANYDILKSMGFRNLDVITTGVDEQNIKKLIRGRIDLWPALKFNALYNIKKMGLKGKIEPINDVVIFKGDLYISFNKNTDDAIIQKWQKALDTLRKRGVIQDIMNKYK